MVPFEGDARLNSAMMPFRFGSRIVLCRERQARAKSGCFSNSLMGTVAFACSTSTVFFAIILSRIVIGFQYSVKWSLAGDRYPLMPAPGRARASLQSGLYHVA